MLVTAVIILAGVVVVASGRGGELAQVYPDYPPIDLGPVTAADVTMLRPPAAAWGYNMRVTDEALQTIARAVTERDVRISALEQEVSDLRGQLGPDGTRPAGGQPAAAPGQPSAEPGGYPQAVAAEPAFEAAAHGQPPHEVTGYADAAHEEAGPGGPAPFPAQAWEPGRPRGDVPGGAAVPDSGPATDPDLPRVPAITGDPARPPSFWDTAGEPAAAPGEPAAAEEPGTVWDEAPHQTLVWGASHQRAKVQRSAGQDPAAPGQAPDVSGHGGDQEAASEGGPGQAGAGGADGGAGEDGPGAGDPDAAGVAPPVPPAGQPAAAGYEEARQPAASEPEHE